MEALNLLRHLKLNQNRYVHDVALYLWILVCFKFLLCNDLEALLIYTFEQQIFSYNFQVYSVPSSAKKKTGKDLISSHLISSHLHSTLLIPSISYYFIYSILFYLISYNPLLIKSNLSHSSYPILFIPSLPSLPLFHAIYPLALPTILLPLTIPLTPLYFS